MAFTDPGRVGGGGHRPRKGRGGRGLRGLPPASVGVWVRSLSGDVRGWRGPLAAVVGGLVPLLFAALLLQRGAGPRAYALLAIVPVAAWLSYRSLSWSRALGRWVGVRLSIARARRVFREALQAARHHPELADLDQMREASRVLSRHVGPLAGAFSEVREAAQHPFAPIRRTVTRMIRSPRIKTPGAGTATPDNLTPGSPSPDGTRTPR